LPAVEGLDLRLLVHAQDHRVLGRVEVQPDHVHHLGHEVGVGGVGEGADPVGLQLVLTEDLVHGVPTDPGGLG